MIPVLIYMGYTQRQTYILGSNYCPNLGSPSGLGVDNPFEPILAPGVLNPYRVRVRVEGYASLCSAPQMWSTTLERGLRNMLAVRLISRATD